MTEKLPNRWMSTIRLNTWILRSNDELIWSVFPFPNKLIVTSRWLTWCGETVTCPSPVESTKKVSKTQRTTLLATTNSSTLAAWHSPVCVKTPLTTETLSVQSPIRHLRKFSTGAWVASRAVHTLSILLCHRSRTSCWESLRGTMRCSICNTRSAGWKAQNNIMPRNRISHLNIMSTRNPLVQRETLPIWMTISHTI